jgi:hypothetical protein
VPTSLLHGQQAKAVCFPRAMRALVWQTSFQPSGVEPARALRGQSSQDGERLDGRSRKRRGAQIAARAPRKTHVEGRTRIGD